MKVTCKYWLMKTEPSEFSFDDLMKRPNATGSWDGVRNYQARNFMRDHFKKGTKVFIYHSSTKIPAVVGIAEVVKEAYPDSTALDKNSPYYDEKSAQQNRSIWTMVDVRAIRQFKKPVTLEQIKKTRGLEKMLLVKRGVRLSIQPVSDKEWEIICKLGEIA